MSNSFQVGGREFKLLKLDAFQQFHITRRMGPILADMLPAMKGIASKFVGIKNVAETVEKMGQEEQLQQIAQFAGPVLTGLSKLSNEDADYVLYGLLSSVEMKQSTGNWTRVVQGTPPMLMIQDIDFPVLMQIAGRAFTYNLSGFFSAIPHQ